MEQKNNTGAIFKHEKTADNQPDYKGKITVDDKQWEIALWVRESQAGKKYMSAAIKEPYVKPEEQQQAPVSTSKKIQDATEDDGLPF